jgi:hypothetical protein
MCNAWNHPPGCTCGWGGEGHLGRRGGGAQGPSSYSSIGRTPSSFVNPNARCPVCQAQVYFYRSEFNGRVYFDDPGPPWPKHPCTDTTAPTTGRPRQLSPHPDGSNVPAWRADGWEPFILENVVSYTPSLLKLTGTHGENELQLYGRLGVLLEQVWRAPVL